MDTQVCPRRILVSNLPSKVHEDRLLDKLEIHFSKKKNGGGEVEEIDMLHDSGTVVVTFVDDGGMFVHFFHWTMCLISLMMHEFISPVHHLSLVAKGLTDQQDHKVDIVKNQKDKVKVTPFLNGEISQLHVRGMDCPNA